MKTKLVVLLFMILLLVNILPVTALETEISIINNEDNIDQESYDENGDDWNGVYFYDITYLAQSFKPSKNRLSSVDVFLSCEKSISHDYQEITLYIRQSLDGANLRSVTLTGNQVDITTHVKKWIKFDLIDLKVIPEKTYYIVIETNLCPQAKWIAHENAYDRGEAWKLVSGEINWDEIENDDFCFKTFGHSKNSYSKAIFSNRFMQFFPNLFKFFTLLFNNLY